MGAVLGIDLEAAGLAGGPPADFRGQPSDDPFEHDVRTDPDARLPWPVPAKLRAATGDLAGRLTPGARYLGGRPIGRGLLEETLASGTQALRQGAALDLCLGSAASGEGRALFEVRAPAFRQARLLARAEAADVAAR